MTMSCHLGLIRDQKFNIHNITLRIIVLNIKLLTFNLLSNATLVILCSLILFMIAWNSLMDSV